VSIANIGASNVNALVTVSRIGLSGSSATGMRSASATRLEVRARSQTVISLPRSGAPGYAAVSVETDRGGVGVAESVVGSSAVAPSTMGKSAQLTSSRRKSAHHKAAGLRVLLSSPCALGAATQGYLPTGSTYRHSDVQLSLYDPNATPSVVNVSVSTGSAPTAPTAFQGVVVPGTSLTVLDIGRWVPQSVSVAVTATAVSGRVVIGALESTSTTVAVASNSVRRHRVRHLEVTGSSLLVGPDHGLRTWAFADGAASKGSSSAFAVYNPGARSVSVRVSPPGPKGLAAALTADVPAGGVVDFETPIAPGGGAQGGSVIISASHGAAVVAARLTTSGIAGGVETVNAIAGTAGSCVAWLLPGAQSAPDLSDVVTLANPGTRIASVRLLEFGGVTSKPFLLRILSLPAGSRVDVNVGAILKHAAGFAILASATGAVLAEQRLTPRSGLTAAVGGIPVRG